MLGRHCRVQLHETTSYSYCASNATQIPGELLSKGKWVALQNSRHHRCAALLLSCPRVGHMNIIRTGKARWCARQDMWYFLLMVASKLKTAAVQGLQTLCPVYILVSDIVSCVHTFVRSIMCPRCVVHCNQCTQLSWLTSITQGKQSTANLSSSLWDANICKHKQVITSFV